MNPSVSPIPAGFHTLTPHIVVSDTRKAADFYRRAFGAELLSVHAGPDGKVMHAEMKIGDSMLMLNDEFPHWGSPSPSTTKTDTCVRLQLYVDDADKLYNAALAAGAQVVMPLADQFWGDRYGQVVDPFGHRWSIATRTKNMSAEELKVAQEEAMAQMAAASKS